MVVTQFLSVSENNKYWMESLRFFQKNKKIKTKGHKFTKTSVALTSFLNVNMHIIKFIKLFKYIYTYYNIHINTTQ